MRGRADLLRRAGLVLGILALGVGSERGAASALASPASVSPVATPAVATIAVAATSSPTPTPAAKPAITPTAPWFGLIAPTTDQIATLAHGQVTRMTLGLGWDSIEPKPGVFSSYEIGLVVARLTVLRNAGYHIVLDLGLQYPPSWVFDLPGATRFVDQYGDAWHGPLSQDVPNAVFNQQVRSAQQQYIAHVAAALGPKNFATVRVGGLLSGELRYPPATYNGHSNLLWDYDATALAQSPYPNWRPTVGTGVTSATQARASLKFYYDSLTGYETWLMKTVAAAFGSLNQEILFPSWGLRPGMTEAAITAGNRGSTNAEINGMISSGLDWPAQVAAISAAHINGTVYCTWLDAPAQGSTAAQVPPIDYLASLAKQYALPVAGENTGGGGPLALSLAVKRAKADGLTGVMYMSGSMVEQGRAGVTLPALLAGLRG
ncbi:hypothetical protein [Jatrophihabitans sp. GAS493]|uniref:hypothetical protein n=1 Tax=Jatrophihabitans sp. GAS493 TaxID=1907575 RepID=UPI0012FD89F5|nr:hypothetical protein [Jatrophihabitans sp. GAS493]